MTAYIHDAVRTPRGKAKPDGGLASLKPQELVAALVDGLQDRGHAPRAAEALMLGCVGQVGAQGGHITLVSKLRAGLADQALAWTVNNYCASGLTAIGQAATLVSSGVVRSALGGGVEMMSRVPFMADRADYYSDTEMPTRARFIPVGVAADRLAVSEGITRAELDAVALTSQQRTAAAEGTGLVASRLSVNGLAVEEAARSDMTAERLAALSPAFAALAAPYAEAWGGAPLDHRHTMGHAPPMSDGASLALLSNERSGARARVVAWAESGGDPEASLTAGFTATDLALERAQLRLADMDRIEFMEAFAVTIAKFLRDSGPAADRVNVGGGHIAKGHPMGATGGILLSSLLDALDVCEGRYGLVVATGAQGIGSAMVVERLN